MFGRLSGWEIVIIVILVVIIFGGRKLPELGRSLGKGLKNFRESVKGEGAEPPVPPTDASGDGQSPPPEAPEGPPKRG
ncbi:MAG: twin-arginine translocase TatA/TatE family subunit [Deltaproteobacteria bacterium]|jgi:sec-independent protein translocase protein TatA|nr:twin-arginine translocase TatA/TatE family subunit [Deltaproteobacteria bacterium]